MENEEEKDEIVQKDESEKQNEKKSSKKFLVIIFALFFLIGGFFMVQQYELKKSAENSMWKALEKKGDVSLESLGNVAIENIKNITNEKSDNKAEGNVDNQNKGDENIETIYEKAEKYTIDGEDFSLMFDVKKDKKTNKEISTLSAFGVCNTKEKAILMETSLMIFFKEFQKMDSDTLEFNHMAIISVTDDNKSTITNSDIDGWQVVGGTNNDGSTASGKMPDWYDSLIGESFLFDGSTEYMEEVKTTMNQFIDDVTNDFQK